MKPPKVDFFISQSVLKFSIFLVFILSLLASCAGLGPPRLFIKPIDSPDEILRKIEIGKKEIRDLKGIARVRVTNVNKSHSFKEVIVVQRPSSLRMETLGFFGQPLFFLTARDDRLSVLSLAENRLYQGEVTQENLSIILPFYLKPKDLFSILLGGVPLIDHLSADIKLAREENLYLVKLMQKGEATKQFLWVDPLDLSVLKSDIYDSSENLILGVKFDNYKRVNGPLFPMSTSISLPLSSTKITINYSELEINTGVNQDNFNLDVPPGVEIVNLDRR